MAVFSYPSKVPENRPILGNFSPLHPQSSSLVDLPVQKLRFRMRNRALYRVLVTGKHPFQQPQCQSPRHRRLPQHVAQLSRR